MEGRPKTYIHVVKIVPKPHETLNIIMVAAGRVYFVLSIANTAN
jgi:hypothetical protein